MSGALARQASPPPGFVTAKMQTLAAHADQMLALAAAPLRPVENMRRSLDVAKQHLSVLTERSRAYPQIYDQADDAGEDADGRLERLKAEIVRADTDVQRLEADIEAALAAHKARDALHELAAHSVNICRDWLRARPDSATLEPAEKVEVPEGDLRGALEKTRSDIADLQGKVRALERAPEPREDVEQAVEAWVAEQARSLRIVAAAPRGEPLTVNFFTPTGPLVPQQPNALWLWAKLAPKALAGALQAAIIADIPKAEPLSGPQLERKAGALTKQLEAAERLEEAPVVALLARGDMTERVAQTWLRASVGYQATETLSNRRHRQRRHRHISMAAVATQVLI